MLSSNIIGTGLIPQARHRSKGKAALAQDLWNTWGETIACDFDGMNDAYGIQALIMRCIAESGECLVRKVRGQTSTEIPLQIQVLEPDFLDSFKTSVTPIDGGGFIIQGVEFDKKGKRIAYWLYDRHPGDVGFFPHSMVSKRIPASDILHIFRLDRVGQVRGIAWSAPCILKLRDYGDFDDAQLLRQKIAACYTAFVHDSEIPVDPSDKTIELTEKVEPGMIQLLPPGKEITFGSPPSVDGYADFSKISLRAIASGYGVTYEQLTGDYSNVNFSSGRMGWIDSQGNIDQWRYHMIIPRLANPIWNWFIEAATVGGNDLRQVTATHTPPKRRMLNPAQEISAQRDSVRAGFTSLSESIREFGDDPKKVLAEIKEDNDFCDKNDLILDSDPRKVTNNGQFQSVKDPSVTDPNSEPNK